MIDIQQLTKRFGGFTAVDNVTFTVEPGEVLGFLGPNGAGKSTTMKMLSGFLEPSSGSVRLFGRDIVRDRIAVQQQLGYLPEGAPAYEDMRVDAYLKFIAEMRGLRGDALRKQLQHVVDLVDIGEVLTQRIQTLSKGFKRRVGLAQTLIHDPQVLILDEPTDGLDPNQKQQVRQLITNLSTDKIVIISTHILEEVSAVCSRAVIIAGGKVVADSQPQELERRSRYHGAITLRLQQPQPQLEAALTALPGVAALETVQTEQSYLLLPERGTTLYPALHALLQQQGWAVDSLHMERGRLDDVFQQLTQQEVA
ncbi:ABC transporter ATP-binding protein [Bacterioplanes sanyensis]|uniref:ABC transporter ATP-binding protein n=1 Tax=Bacterioplanes sanyensis TaxID=1249553 RepID=A0A222FJI9_9GAMM|nr:ABC transporter ATP-binding protein [Bacterioplanes sanyensis]ASP39215.1 ABC transporter ATP-binding protein [Bacterioplanes sanyensis]